MGAPLRRLAHQAMSVSDGCSSTVWTIAGAKCGRKPVFNIWLLHRHTPLHSCRGACLSEDGLRERWLPLWLWCWLLPGFTASREDAVVAACLWTLRTHKLMLRPQSKSRMTQIAAASVSAHDRKCFISTILTAGHGMSKGT